MTNLIIILIFFSIYYFYFVYEILKLKNFIKEEKQDFLKVIYQKEIAQMYIDLLEVNTFINEKSVELKDIIFEFIKINKIFNILYFLVDNKIVKNVHFIRYDFDKMLFFISNDELYIYIQKEILNNIKSMELKELHLFIINHFFKIRNEITMEGSINVENN